MKAGIKRFFSCLLFSMLVFSQVHAFSNTNKMVRGCNNWGFFAEFLWVLNHLEYCKTNGMVPVIHWGSKFAYYSPLGYNGSQNPWEYYFEPVSEMKYVAGDKIHTEDFYNNYFSTILWYGQYINTLHLLPKNERRSIKKVDLPMNLAGPSGYPVGDKHIYSKSFRKFVKDKLIDRYVRIKSSIKKKINKFYFSNMKDKHVVGLHLRGGFIYNEVNVVPIDVLCAEANRHARTGTVFYIATDQMPLIETAKKLLNGPVIYYDCYRQDVTTSPTGPGQWPPEMGEDILVEAQLLSRCNYFVHTISNVSTAVLYFNPNLEHTMMYCAGEKN